MKCANCQAEIPEASQFCLKCGKPLGTRSAAEAFKRALFGISLTEDPAEPAKPDQQKKVVTTLTEKVFYIGVALVIAIFAISVIGPTTETENKPSKTAPPASKSIGDDAVLAVRDTSVKVFVCVDEKAYDEFNNAVAAKDNIGVSELVSQNRVFMVDANTKVKVLDIGFFKTKVRILEGAMFGRSGFVSREWVR